MNEKVATINRAFKRKDIPMSIMRVIFKGSQDDQVFDNFTVNSVYLAKPYKNGSLTVLDDTGTLVEMPTANFEMKINESAKELVYVC